MVRVTPVCAPSSISWGNSSWCPVPFFHCLLSSYLGDLAIKQRLRHPGWGGKVMMKAKFKPQPGKFLSASSSVPDKSQGDSLPVPGTETAGDRLGQGEFPPSKKWAPSRGFLFTLRASVWATVCKVYFNLQFFLAFFFLNCMCFACMYVCALHVLLYTACMSVHCMSVARGCRRQCESPGTGVTDTCEPPYRCWDPARSSLNALDLGTTPASSLHFFFFCSFETGSCCVAQADLKLVTLLPQPP